MMNVRQMVGCAWYLFTLQRYNFFLIYANLSNKI